MKTATVGTPGIDEGVVEVPETLEEAEADFTCAVTRCRFTGGTQPGGHACAARHRRHSVARDTEAIVNVCGTCPAGAARLAFIGDRRALKKTYTVERLIARHKRTRAQTDAAILAVFENRGVMTRIEVAGATGVRRNGVSAYLNRLIASGDLVRLTPAEGGRARYALPKDAAGLARYQPQASRKRARDPRRDARKARIKKLLDLIRSAAEPMTTTALAEAMGYSRGVADTYIKELRDEFQIKATSIRPRRWAAAGHTPASTAPEQGTA